MAITAERWNTWAPLPLRAVIGFGFMFHGAPKLFTSEGHAMFQQMLVDLNVPAPQLMSWVGGCVEFFGGLAIFVGAFVSLAAILLVVNMLVALFKVHLPAGFNFLNITGKTETGALQFGMPGYEVNLLYIAALLALAIGGAGAISVDRSMAPKITVSEPRREAEREAEKLTHSAKYE